MGPKVERASETLLSDASSHVLQAEHSGHSEDTTSIDTGNSCSTLTKPRRLIPLRPKLTSKSSGQHTSRPRLRPPGPCGIRLCEKVSCTLQSHRHYTRRKPAPNAEGSSSSATKHSHAPAVSLRRSTTPAPQVQKTIAKAAGFPVLPLDKKEAANPGLNHLFHDFFIRLLNRILNLIIPPFNGYAEWTKQRHDVLFGRGTTTRLDCLNFVGAAYVSTLGHSHSISPNKNATGIVVHSSIMKQLRETLEQFDPAKDAESVLNVIYTLAMFDLASNSRAQQSPLLLHRSAMVRVIQGCGGLDRIGPVLSLVISLDRLISIVIEQPPLYTEWEHIKIPIQRAAVHPAVYGEAFATKGSSKTGMDDDIVSYCMEVCRAIEILEGENWKFDTTSTESNGEIYYLYYLRDRVAAQFTHLNARLAKENSRERCILLAAKIVEYIALVDNYNATLSNILADRLMQLLDEQDMQKVWGNHKNVIQWILFVLICKADHWDGREDQLQRYYKALRTFDDIDSSPWEDRQKQNVTNFVWSWTLLGDAFESACQQIMAD